MHSRFFINFFCLRTKYSSKVDFSEGNLCKRAWKVFSIPSCIKNRAGTATDKNTFSTGIIHESSLGESIPLASLFPGEKFAIRSKYFECLSLLDSTLHQRSFRFERSFKNAPGNFCAEISWHVVKSIKRIYNCNFQLQNITNSTWQRARRAFLIPTGRAKPSSCQFINFIFLCALLTRTWKYIRASASLSALWLSYFIICHLNFPLLPKCSWQWPLWISKRNYCCLPWVCLLRLGMDNLLIFLIRILQGGQFMIGLR